MITPDSDMDLLKQARKRIANLAENVEKGNTRTWPSVASGVR